MNYNYLKEFSEAKLERAGYTYGIFTDRIVFIYDLINDIITYIQTDYIVNEDCIEESKMMLLRKIEDNE